jgi:hypothetical protein
MQGKIDRLASYQLVKRKYVFRRGNKEWPTPVLLAVAIQLFEEKNGG